MVLIQVLNPQPCCHKHKGLPSISTTVYLTQLTCSTLYHSRLSPWHNLANEDRVPVGCRPSDMRFALLSSPYNSPPSHFFNA
eukprot:1152296-Pelagomonas_calceolata.AAC.1